MQTAGGAENEQRAQRVVSYIDKKKEMESLGVPCVRDGRRPPPCVLCDLLFTDL